MSPPSPLSPVLALRVEAARRLGCDVVPLDPETGYLHEVRRGKVLRLFLGAFSPLNDACAARLASDKFHTALVLRHAGIRVAPGVRCLKAGRFLQEDFSSLEGTAPAERFAARYGFPLVAKPNRGARGRQVSVVGDADELGSAIHGIWELDYLALVQPVISGVDVRLDFLDGEFLIGYVRRPVILRGDGTSTVSQLLVSRDSRFKDRTFRDIVENDPIWVERCRNQGLGPDSVLPAEDVLDLGSAILNLNRICFADLLGEIEPSWAEHGRLIGETLGLRHYGIDFKAEDPESDPRAATVLEVNASPSLAQISRMGYYEEALEAEMRLVDEILNEKRQPLAPTRPNR